MVRELQTTIPERIDTETGLFDLPDSDTTEGSEPNYGLIVISLSLLTLGMFLLLRQYIQHYNQRRQA